jgi:hypothetical protein
MLKSLLRWQRSVIGTKKTICPKSLEIGEHTYHFLTSEIEYIEFSVRR